MNQVNLIGRITKDLELRSTNNGQGKFVSFTLAVSEYSKDKEITNFIPCFAFNNTAENMSRYVGKGSLILVSGKINVRSSQNDGKYETHISVNANQVRFLENSKDKYHKEDNYSNTRKSGIIGNEAFDDEIILSDDESVLWD